jgi:uncharacterized membrane protein
MYKYLIYFLAFSFLGWLTEEVFYAVKTGGLTNRGLCKGPFCPIYGVGVLTSYLLLSSVNNFLLLVLLSMSTATLVEFSVGVISERVLGTRLWDYSNERGNILGYVCPRFSVIWGIVCAGVIKLLPYTNALVERLDTPIFRTVLISVFVLLVLDIKASMRQVKTKASPR